MSKTVPFGAPACEWCGTALSRHQAIRSASCGAPACERSRIAKISQTTTDRHRIEHDALKTKLVTQCDTQLDEAAKVLGTDRDDTHIGVVPYNRKGLSKLPQARHLALEAHLTKIAEEGFVGGIPEPERAARERGAIDLPEAKATDAACGTCKGNCCKAGGPTWGFLTVTDVHRFRNRHPERDAAEFLEYYLSFLPDESVPENCVYQGPVGCTLERTDRASLCNSFLCRGVKRLLADIEAHGAAPTTIIAHTEGEPEAIGLFDPASGELSQLASGVS